MLQLQFNFTKKQGKEAISLWKNVLEKSIKLRSTNNDTKINNISSHWKGIFEAASKPPSIRYCNRQVPLNSLIHPFLPTQQLSNTRTATAQSRPTGEWPASLLNSLGKAPGSFFLPLHLHLPVSRKTFIRQVSPIPQLNPVIYKPQYKPKPTHHPQKPRKFFETQWLHRANREGSPRHRQKL